MKALLFVLALCCAQVSLASQGQSSDPGRTNQNTATITAPARQLQEFEGSRDRGPDSTISGGRSFTLPDSSTPAPQNPTNPDPSECPPGTYFDPGLQRCVVSQPPPPPPPQVCQDPTANNFGGPLPCRYGGGNPPPPPPPPPQTCQDPTATNFGGPLPCNYAPPSCPSGTPFARGAAGALPPPDCGCPAGQTYDSAANVCREVNFCQDPSATNFGGPAPCRYPDPPQCRWPPGTAQALCECDGAGVIHRFPLQGTGWQIGACPPAGGRDFCVAQQCN